METNLVCSIHGTCFWFLVTLDDMRSWQIDENTEWLWLKLSVICVGNKLQSLSWTWSTTLEILNLILAGQSVSGLLWRSVLTFWWRTLWEHFQRPDNSTNLCCAQFWKFYKTFQRNHWDCPHCKGWQEKLILVYIHKEHLLLQWLVTCYFIRETKG